MVARVDTAAAARRHHNQRGRSVGARVAGTAAQTYLVETSHPSP